MIDRRAFLKAAALTAAPVVPVPVEPIAAPLANRLHAESEHRQDLPEERALLFTVDHTAHACEEMLDAHGEDCGCVLCDAVYGLWYNLGVALACLESNLLTRIRDVKSCPCCGSTGTMK
jgi:hypothetical protein